ncbi:sugar kinase [Micromonospora sp. WMMD812]|uniref:sugar kinase n=1 Tax=Micromonospora sp. WMMD812 TaxID=3015152 RepID=UPI00248CC346|nr:sugar kinase [Micromonospora sp. WMMD812]WBB68081.1 sugar kinase [Micromonospora sp. WMMD812]
MTDAPTGGLPRGGAPAADAPTRGLPRGAAPAADPPVGPAPIDVLTLGETMAAFRTTGALRLGGTAGVSIAGAESTVAIGLARLGHRAGWIGVTGADEPGALVRRTLRAEGVDLTWSRVEPGAPTGLILFEPRVADLNRVTYYRAGSAGSRLAPADVIRAFDAVSPRVLHVTGITCALGAGPYAAVRVAVERAHAAGATVCLDVNHRSRLWSVAEAAEALRPLLPAVDVVVASDDELPVLTDADDPVAALRAAGVDEVVVKRGGDGATSHHEGGTLHRPARRVPVVETIGAGDAFVAGWLSALLDGADAAGRLDRAVTTAAFTVATRGDWEGLPDRAELPLLDHEPGTALR